MVPQLERLSIVDRLKHTPVHVAVFWTTLMFIQAALVLLYLQLTGTRILSLRYAVFYPFLWINVSIWVLWRARPQLVSRTRAIIAIAVGLGYFMVLVLIPELIGSSAGGDGTLGLDIHWLLPGWGPLFIADLGPFRPTLPAYQATGYLALSYLVAINVLRFNRGSLAGVLGVITCVGCVAPVLVTILGAFGGIGATLASVTTTWFLDIGTAVFLIAVALLYRSAHRQ